MRNFLVTAKLFFIQMFLFYCLVPHLLQIGVQDVARERANALYAHFVKSRHVPVFQNIRGNYEFLLSQGRLSPFFVRDPEWALCPLVFLAMFPAIATSPYHEIFRQILATAPPAPKDPVLLTETSCVAVATHTTSKLKISCETTLFFIRVPPFILFLSNDKCFGQVRFSRVTLLFQLSLAEFRDE